MDNVAYLKQEEHQYEDIPKANTDWEKENRKNLKYLEANQNIKGHVTVIPANKHESNRTSTILTHIWRWLLIVIGISILAALIGILIVLLKRDCEPQKLTTHPTLLPTDGALVKDPQMFSTHHPILSSGKVFSSEQPSTTDSSARLPSGVPMKAQHGITCNLNDASLRPLERNRNYLKPSDVCWLSENQLAALTEHYLVIVNIDRKKKTCEYLRSYHIRGVVATRLACASNGFTYAKVDRWHNRGIRVSTNLTYGSGWYPGELESYIKQYTVSTDSILIESGNNLYMYDLQRRFKEKIPIQVQGPQSYGPAYLSAGGWLWRTTTVIGSTGLWVNNIHGQESLVINGTYTYGVTGVGQHVLLPDYYSNSIRVYSHYGLFHRNLQMDRVVQRPVNVAAIGETLAVIPDGTWNIEIFDLK